MQSLGSNFGARGVEAGGMSVEVGETGEAQQQSFIGERNRLLWQGGAAILWEKIGRETLRGLTQLTTGYLDNEGGYHSPRCTWYCAVKQRRNLGRATAKPLASCTSLVYLGNPRRKPTASAMHR